MNQACDGYHFAEWYAAIHLFGRDGACSVMEKYDTWENHYLEHRRKRHLDKVALCERVVPEEHPGGASRDLRALPSPAPRSVGARTRRSYCFAEVKGPTDGTINSDGQVGMRTDIRERLGVAVEVIKISLVA